MLDYHCWIEINGNIVDWDTKSNTLKKYLTLCASLNLRTNKYTVEYVEWGKIDSITADKIKQIENDSKKDLDLIKNDKTSLPKLYRSEGFSEGIFHPCTSWATGLAR